MKCRRLPRHGCEPVCRVQKDPAYAPRRADPAYAPRRADPAYTPRRAGLFRPAGIALAGITLISVPQEIEIGREENAQVRKQMKELRDPPVTAYVARLGHRLGLGAPGANSPYSFLLPHPPP